MKSHLQNTPTGRLGIFQLQPTLATGAAPPAAACQLGVYEIVVASQRFRMIESTPTCRLGDSEPLRGVFRVG